MQNNAKLKESKSNDRRRTQLFSSRRRHRQLCTHTRAHTKKCDVATSHLNEALTPFKAYPGKPSVQSYLDELP